MPSQINTDRVSPSSTPFGIIQRKLDARTSLVSVEGELDLFTAPSLKRALVDALQAGSSRLVVDLSLTTFIDSTTLGVLVGVMRKFEDGARLAIVCTRPNVRKIFEFSGLDGTFAIFPTLDEALTHARGNEACAS
ncbi:MAG TPA: STAS domain-containing protein [Solirubrobacteraceae bacterium]|nr:STAS domain-containing protein [Solirubrobacteraceae bacterium]